MKNQLHFLRLRLNLSPLFPYVALLVWILPLLLLNSGSNSLMSHDEGLYAVRARQMFDAGDWMHPWAKAHHKTPGFYWIIASFYHVFGINELSVRIASVFFGILSTFLLYEIGKIILNQRIAWLAAAILNTEFLWLQYSRLGTPDIAFVFLALLAIFSLLKAESYSPYLYVWEFLAGASLGLGFLVRGFMVFLPVIALLPYLFVRYKVKSFQTAESRWKKGVKILGAPDNTGKRYQFIHINLNFYLFGLIVSLIPTLVWLWQNYLYYGNAAFEELFGFVIQLGLEQRNNHSLAYYFWNVLIKAFPWSCLAIIGIIVATGSIFKAYKTIFIWFPINLFIGLSLFSTRLPHYSLILYPFIALFAALGIDWLFRQMQANKYMKLLMVISYFFGILGILLIIGSIVLRLMQNQEFYTYSNIGLFTGLGWLTLLLVWLNRNNWGRVILTSKYWLICYLITPWICLSLVAMYGFIGDYNPKIKAFFRQEKLEMIFQNNLVEFVDVGGKTGVLLNFYTPKIGKQLKTTDELKANSYAWIKAEESSDSAPTYLKLGKIENYLLIKWQDS